MKRAMKKRMLGKLTEKRIDEVFAEVDTDGTPAGAGLETRPSRRAVFFGGGPRRRRGGRDAGRFPRAT